MTSEETKEKKITRTMEKVIMSFMYLLFGFMFLGIRLEEIPIKIFVRYSVKPIGIRTTTPAIK